MNLNSNLEFRKIRSLDFLYEINENGTILRNIKSKKQIKIILDKHHSESGYYTAFICVKKEVKRVTIHKVVAECWLGERPYGLQIDHIDRNSHNNHYTNLRYVNHSEQMKNRVLGERVVKQAIANCKKWTEYISKPVIIYKNNISIEFPSMNECSRYLGGIYNGKSELFRDRLRKRRKHIRDYDIKYLNAETRHTNSTE